jgi:hypothetical protein
MNVGIGCFKQILIWICPLLALLSDMFRILHLAFWDVAEMTMEISALSSWNDERQD